ncbi:recombinase family protein [Quadrisphaera oryzae]|uniref:recombinase family protein n=1 Tax=Quadrisphaera TaxID=317661 RepID=UPI00351C4E3C
MQELESRGVGFRSLTENIDTTTAGGRLVVHMFGAIGDFERDLIRDRVNAGLAAARARGRVGGRPAALTEAQARQARDLKAAGESVASIATTLKVGRSTLYRYLTVE